MVLGSVGGLTGDVQHGLSGLIDDVGVNWVD